VVTINFNLKTELENLSKHSKLLKINCTSSL